MPSAKKILIKRGLLLLLVLALSSLGVYGTYRFTNKDKRGKTKFDRKSRTPPNEDMRRRERRPHVPREEPPPIHVIPPPENNDSSSESNNSFPEFNISSPEPLNPPQETPPPETRPPQDCATLNANFKSTLTDFFSKHYCNTAYLAAAYQEAKAVCSSDADLDIDYNKELVDLVKEEYYQRWNAIIKDDYISIILFDCLNLEFSLYTVRLFDDQFLEGKVAKQILCEYFHREFKEKLEAKSDYLSIKKMWTGAKQLCEGYSFPEFEQDDLSEYFIKRIFKELSNLDSASDREKSKEELLSLITFWNSFENVSADQKFEGITNIESLDHYIANRKQFELAYPSFKEKYNICIKKLDSNADPSEEEIRNLDDALQNILRFVSSASYIADSEMSETYRILQRTKANGGSAQQALFEHYDSIIRLRILNNIKPEVAQATFAMMLNKFGALVQKYYGNVTSLDETNDFHLSRGIFSNTSCLPADFFDNKTFHFFNFSEEVKQMLLWMIETEDRELRRILGKSLDLHSQIVGDETQRFKAFGDYALARKRYITKEFKDEGEIEADYSHLKELLEIAAALDATPRGFKQLYELPRKAVPCQVPIECSDADANFIQELSALMEDPVKGSQFKSAFSTAARACKTFKDYNRAGFDGHPVSFDRFYAGTEEDFLNRLFDYAAEKLRDLTKDQRADSEYSCELGSRSLLEFKEEIDQRLEALESNN